MEEGAEGVSFGDSGAGSPCQELRESSTNRNNPGGASAGPWMAQGCEPPHCPQQLGPKLLLLKGWGETISIWGAGATSWFLSPGIFISKGSTAAEVDGHPSREAGRPQRSVSLRSQPQKLHAPKP